VKVASVVVVAAVVATSASMMTVLELVDVRPDWSVAT
jgi:hypothetical protein